MTSPGRKRCTVRELPDQVAVLELAGSVDGSAAASIREALKGLFDEGRTRIVVSWAQATFVDLLGMAAVLSDLVRLRRAGGDVRFCGLNAELRELVTAKMGLERLVQIFDRETEAVRGYSGAGPAAKPEPRKLWAEERALGPVTLVTLRGALDADESLAALKALLERLVAEGRTRVVVDCEELLWVSSSGFGLLIVFSDTLVKNGGGVRYCRLKGLVKTVIERMGAAALFRCFDDPLEAVASFVG